MLVCGHTRLHASIWFFAGAFKFCKYVFCEGTAISEVLSSGWKAATNPLYNSVQKKADKIEWGGEAACFQCFSFHLQLEKKLNAKRPHRAAFTHISRHFKHFFLRSLFFFFCVWVLSLGLSEGIKVTVILHLLGIWINIRAVSSAVWEHNAPV